MQRPQITPGPWNFTPCPENAWNVSGHILAKGQHVETATAMCKGEANARAIAALPALLEALELAETTLQRIALDGSRATQGTRDVITAAFKLAGYEF